MKYRKENSILIRVVLVEVHIIY